MFHFCIRSSKIGNTVRSAHDGHRNIGEGNGKFHQDSHVHRRKSSLSFRISRHFRNYHQLYVVGTISFFFIPLRGLGWLLCSSSLSAKHLRSHSLESPRGRISLSSMKSENFLAMASGCRLRCENAHRVRAVLFQPAITSDERCWLWYWPCDPVALRLWWKYSDSFHCHA